MTEGYPHIIPFFPNLEIAIIAFSNVAVLHSHPEFYDICRLQVWSLLHILILGHLYFAVWRKPIFLDLISILPVQGG
jgi:hypothetical protein